MSATTPYGAEGRAYPVAPGTVWQCGDHLFRCGDLREWTPPVPLAVIYSDPPWGAAALNGFYRRAMLRRPEHTWQDVYRAIMALGDEHCDLWLECGPRQVEEVVAMMPARYVQTFPIVYGNDRPAKLVYGGLLEPPLSLADGEHDDNTPRMVMDAYGGTGFVYDPCAGRGLTSRCAVKAGWLSINNELNPLRVSAALARMRRLIGQEVHRVS